MEVLEFKQLGLKFKNGDVLRNKDKVTVLTKASMTVVNDSTDMDRFNVVDFSVRKGASLLPKEDGLLIRYTIKNNDGTFYTSAPVIKDKLKSLPDGETLVGWEPWLPFDKCNTVHQFKGEFNWLSNMYKLEKPWMSPHGPLPTVEHIYHYHKSTSDSWRRYVAQVNNPYEVREVSRNEKYCKLQDNWDEVRDEIMELALAHKYSDDNPTILSQLLNLKDWLIVEGNYHGDIYWGYCLKTETGENRLGILTMERRDFILERE